MQSTLTLRKSSVNSIAALAGIILALAAGTAGGYVLRAQAPASATAPARSAAVAPASVSVPNHDMPEDGAGSSRLPNHDMPAEP